MATRLFLVYVLVELAVVVGLVSTIGFGWTVLALVATFGLGLALAGSQLTRQLGRLQSALNTRRDDPPRRFARPRNDPPRRFARPGNDPTLATDSVLVALGTVLVAIPGLASSLVGALLLLPPSRAAARPLANTVINRQLNRAVPVMVYSSSTTTTTPAGHGDYVDGEVIDVVDEVITPTPLDRPHP